MGHFFLKNWYLYGSSFKFCGGTSLTKLNLHTPPWVNTQRTSTTCVFQGVAGAGFFPANLKANGQCNKMDLDQVPSLWWNKPVQLNIANPGELVKIHLIAWTTSARIIVGFFIPVSSLKVFGHSIYSERRMISLGKSIQALQNDTITIWCVCSFRVIQPLLQWNFCLFSSILVHYKNFRLIFNHKIQVKTLTWPDTTLYAQNVTLMCQKKKKRESNKRAPGWVVIFI